MWSLKIVFGSDLFDREPEHHVEGAESGHVGKETFIQCGWTFFGDDLGQAVDWTLEFTRTVHMARGANIKRWAKDDSCEPCAEGTGEMAGWCISHVSSLDQYLFVLVITGYLRCVDNWIPYYVCAPWGPETWDAFFLNGFLIAIDGTAIPNAFSLEVLQLGLVL